MTPLADQIRRLRRRRGWSTRVLAKVAGMSQPRIVDLEQGHNVNPKLDMLARIAAALGAELTVRIVQRRT